MTRVLILALLLSPCLLHSTNSRHVGTADESASFFRVARSLKDKYKDLFETIETERYSKDNVEVETTFITACVGLEDEVKAMKGLVEAEKAQNKDLENTNFELKKQLREEVASNRQTGYESAMRVAEMQLKLSGWIDQMGSKTVKISKLTLRALSRYIEYKDLEIKIGKTEDSSKLTGMKKQLEQKKKELTQAEQELIASGGSSNLVLQVISLQEKIRELESKESDEDTLKEIAKLKKALKEKRTELQSSGGIDESSVLIPEIAASQDDILELYNKMQILISQSKAKIAELEKQLKDKRSKLKSLRESSDSSASEIAQLEKEVAKLEGKIVDQRRDKAAESKELEKAIQKKKDLLQGKVTDLQNNHGTDYDLILKVITKQLQMGEAQNEVCSGQTDTEELLSGIQKKLSAREEEILSLEAQNERLQKQVEQGSEEFSGLSDKYKAVQKELREKTALLTAAEEEKAKQELKVQEKVEENAKLEKTITALEKSKAEMEDSCSSLKDKYKDLKTKFEEDMSKIEGVPKLVLKINTLNSEIESLKRAVDRDSGDKTELKKKLAEKQEQLEAAEKDLGDTSPSSKSIKELITIIKERATIKADTNSDYLRQISDLEEELNKRIKQLTGKEAERMEAVVRVMEQQDEITQLKRRLSKTKQDSSQKIAEKEAELEKKKNEINELIAKDCGSNKRKVEIASLESEAKKLQAEIKALRESAERDIAALEKRLKKKEEDVKTSSEKLESLDKKGALIAKAIKMQDEMKDILNGEKTLKQTTADEISDLKKQLQEKESENAELKAKNEELLSGAKKAKACATLEEANEALKADKTKLQDLLKAKEEENKKLMDKVGELDKKAAEEKEKEIKVAQPAIDPDTAHEKLQLSKDFKEMKLLVNPLNLAKLSTRYDVALGAMAKTGFDSGRQYWEVSVGGKLCYILGVAGEAAQRKGTIRYLPRFQYWTLRLSRNDELIALDKKQKMLMRQGTDKPTKIGVLIDFKKKEISFYDAGRKAHMYSFSNVDTESKLFPFMSTCEDTDVGSPPMVFNAEASADYITS
ncbi:hypothetical protein ACEWY4_006355 [Coilia grayii]|uniref:B30.2/SPRY domain-containing protein n=1 Tax=Coilia grayii TaxID=363190 RepID=A0ABD1KDI2_9TELE